MLQRLLSTPGPATSLRGIVRVLLAAGLVAGRVAAEGPFQLPKEEIRIKEGAGAEQLKSNCLLCHSSEYITTQPVLTRAQWTATVEKMRAKYGAPLVTNSVPVILDYLTRNYGKESPPKR